MVESDDSRGGSGRQRLVFFHCRECRDESDRYAGRLRDATGNDIVLSVWSEDE
jgi:hypothetical protein